MKRHNVVVLAIALFATSFCFADGQVKYENRQKEKLVRIDFTHAQITDCIFTQARLSALKLQAASLFDSEWPNGKFYRTGFRGSQFSSLSLEGASFEDVNLGGVRLVRSDLRDADFSALKLDSLTVGESSGDQTEWENVSLTRPRLRAFSLTDARWERGKLSGSLDNVELPGLKLYRCSGRDLKIEHFEARDVSCDRLRIYDLEVDNTEVSGAQFENVKMPRSRCVNVDLQGSRFERSDLRDVRLSNCDLEDARLERCDLRDARFENCEIRGLVINGHNIEDLIRKAGR